MERDAGRTGADGVKEGTRGNGRYFANILHPTADHSDGLDRLGGSDAEGAEEAGAGTR